MSLSSSSNKHIPTPPPSQSEQTLDDESYSSDESSQTTTHRNFTMANEQVPDEGLTKNPKRFGSAIQQFSQDLTKSLSWYQIVDKLNDKNFALWSQPVLEALMSLDYIKYVKKTSYRDQCLTDAEHLKVKFIITTWLLSLMDTEN